MVVFLRSQHSHCLNGCFSFLLPLAGQFFTHTYAQFWCTQRGFLLPQIVPTTFHHAYLGLQRRCEHTFHHTNDDTPIYPPNLNPQSLIFQTGLYQSAELNSRQIFRLYGIFSWLESSPCIAQYGCHQMMYTAPTNISTVYSYPLKMSLFMSVIRTNRIVGCWWWLTEGYVGGGGRIFAVLHPSFSRIIFSWLNIHGLDLDCVSKISWYVVCEIIGWTVVLGGGGGGGGGAHTILFLQEKPL